jgi:hypothetical protein
MDPSHAPKTIPTQLPTERTTRKSARSPERARLVRPCRFLMVYPFRFQTEVFLREQNAEAEWGRYERNAA